MGDNRIGMIEILIALGLWTPTEPKSVEDEAVEFLTEHGGWRRHTVYSLIEDLKAAGFTVTKAVK